LSLRIFITGSDGFIGRHLCRYLISDGHVVTAVSRNGVYCSGAEKSLASGSICTNKDWGGELLDIDVVIHLAGVTHASYLRDVNLLDYYRDINVGGTSGLAKQAKESGVRRFIFMSSIKVNGDVTTSIDDPMNPARTPTPEDYYGLTKWEAEKSLLSIPGFTGSILRPSLVYGPGQKGNLDFLCKALLKRIPMPLARVQNQRSFIYIENLVSAVVAAVERISTKFEVFTLSDMSLSTPELITALAKALGRRAYLFPFPVGFLKVLAAAVNKSPEFSRLTESLLVDASDAHSVLGWAPEVSFLEAVRKTGASYLNE
jgi:nucleoside-diphosphate-sugar epimerase